MKNLYALIITVCFGSISFSQVEIHLDSDPATVQNGQSVNVSVDHYGYNVYMHCVNTSSSSMDYNFRRVIMSSTGSFTDQFCNSSLCFNCSGPDWTSPAVQTVAAADSTIMKPVINYSGGGTALLRYYVLDANNGDQIIDSVDINITSTVGIEEVDISFSSYPNPASGDFFIKFSGNEGMDFNVVVYNVLGAEVMKRNLSNGTNKLNVASLNNGVYFYSIVTGNEIIETKKLIVRH